MRQAVTLVALLFASMTYWTKVCAGTTTRHVGARPNVVIILCDDLGFSDIGCYGGEIDTPNLDRLAANGLRFTDFHNNGKCSQTRASLLTGLWHQQSMNLKTPGHVTIAEVLRAAGYSTLMSGKWHVAQTPPDRGFDRYFGFLGGAINFFTGLDWEDGTNRMRLGREVYDVPEGFYSTDAFTDYAIEFVDEALKADRPFFLYLAHNAPHFPLHAHEEDIKKYRGKYDVGWDVIRQRRFARLQRLGIADESWSLSTRDDKVESWEALTDRQKAFLAPMMEVYAAMVDRLDQNIGRLVSHLAAKEQLENTLILFMSDNGACPYQRLRNDVLTPGPVTSDIAYDARWANMCNTPLRLYKQYAHEGGTLTPMIAHWPNGIQAPGRLSDFTSHLVDFMPTVLKLSGGTYPQRDENGRPIHSMEGESLVPVFQGVDRKREAPLYWDFNANHAVRSGDWKLVAERGRDWELYNLALDRCETQDQAKRRIDRVGQLSRMYDHWAERTGAHSHRASMATRPNQQPQLFDLDSLLDER